MFKKVLPGLVGFLLLAFTTAAMAEKPRPYQLFKKPDRLAPDENSLLEYLGVDTFDMIKRAAEKGDLSYRMLSILAPATRHPGVRDLLLQVLKDPRSLDTSKATRWRIQAIEGLGRMASDEASSVAVSAFLQDRNRNLRRAAQEYIEHHPTPRNVDLLIQTSEKERPGTDSPIRRTLALIGTPRALAHLTDVMKQNKAYMGWYGSLAVALAKEKRSEFLPIWLEKLERLVKHGNSCDNDLLRAPGFLGDRRAVDVLARIVEKRNFRHRYWAAWSLGRLKDKSALPALRKAFAEEKGVPASPAYENKAVLAWAMAELGEPAGKDYLLAQEKSDDPLQRMHAWIHLLRLTGKSEYAQKMVEAYRLYRDVTNGCPRYPNEMAAEVLAEHSFEEVRSLLVELSEFKQANGVYSAARRFLRHLPAAEKAKAITRFLLRGSWADSKAKTFDLLNLPLDPFPYFAQISREANQDGRVRAVRTLGLFRPKGYRRHLKRALKDPAWQVALEAQAQLNRKPGQWLWPDSIPALPSREEKLWGYSPSSDYLPFLPDSHNKIHPYRGQANFDVLELQDGRIAFANGSGLQIFDGMQWLTWNRQDGLCDDVVFDLALRNGKLLVLGPRGLAEEQGRGFVCRMADRETYRLLVDKGRVLIGSEKGVLEYKKGKFRQLPGLDAPIGSLALDARGGLWAGLVSDGDSMRSMDLPRVHRLWRGRWTGYEEPFVQYFKGRHSPNEVRGHIDVFDMQIDAKGRLLVATTFGLLRKEGETWRNMNATHGNHPWTVVSRVAEGSRGELYLSSPAYLEILDKGKWSRQYLESASGRFDHGRPLYSERQGSLANGILLGSRGGIWVSLNSYVSVSIGQHKSTQADGRVVMADKILSAGLVRVMDRDPERMALPPETVIASIFGTIRVENSEGPPRLPNRARKFKQGEVVDLPSNSAVVSAVAKDPWDYSAVEFRFKLDDRDWTEWSDKNTLVTPADVSEGVHTARVQARDEQGNVDPTPAEIRFRLRPKDIALIKIHNGDFQRIFPSQTERYKQVGLGKVEVENRTTVPMEFDLRLEIEGLSEPARTRVKLAAGERRWLPVKASLLEAAVVNPGQRTVQALVTAEFLHNDIKRTAKQSFPVVLLESNAFEWDRPERIGSFINGRDPLVEQLAAALFREFSGQHPELARPSHPLHRHLLALYAFNALNDMGLRYKPDSKRPFSSLKKGALDTVNYPSQTLVSRVGDCDDLTVLYSSVLEALNVPTAIVPVRGHVFMMYDTGVLAENRAAFPVESSKTIVRQGSLWVPVETTLLGKAKGFEQAWTRGAENYHGKYKVAPKGVVEMASAWQDSPPTAWPGAAGRKAPTLRLAQARAEAGNLLAGYVKRVEEQAGSGRDPKALLNKGALLAKSGMFKEAIAAYEAAVQAAESHQAFYGLATAQAGAGEMLMALVNFEKALALAPDNKARFACELAIAQCYKVNGNVKKSRKHLQVALTLNPTARFDGRYRSLVDFLQSDQETKASGDEETPPYFQSMLSGL